MKKSIFCLALVLAAGQIFSQNSNLVSSQNSKIASVWQRLESLEGDWYLNERGMPVYSKWVRSDAQTLENLTIGLLCGDTIRLSQTRLTLADEQVQLSTAVDSAGGKWQFFKLEEPSVEDGFANLFFKNEAGERLGWQFDGEGFFTFVAEKNGEVVRLADYRRFYERVTNIEFKIRAAANLTTIRKSGDLFGKQRFEPRGGAEIAFAAGIRSLDGPLSLNVELGVQRRSLFVHSVLPDYSSVVRRGEYTLTNAFFAVQPEVFFGRRQVWSALASFYYTISARTKYEGQLLVVGDGQGRSDWMHPDRDVQNGADWGFSLGFSRKITGHFLPPDTRLQARWQIGMTDVDNLYERGGNSGSGQLRLTNFSIGVSTRLGKF